jgi:hypothetical protein
MAIFILSRSMMGQYIGFLVIVLVPNLVLRLDLTRQVEILRLLNAV